MGRGLTGKQGQKMEKPLGNTIIQIQKSGHGTERNVTEITLLGSVESLNFPLLDKSLKREQNSAFTE
jgi:hypothetical protein